VTQGAPAPPTSVLLDTCAVIWLVNGGALSAEAVSVIRDAGQTDGVHVSTASAWEIGMLSRPRPRRAETLDFLPDPKTWFAKLMGMPGIRQASITAAIAIHASYLPGDFRADPMDRLIVATARHLGMPIVTSDRKILAYAKAGFVQAIPC
jgi:PIN domain nuclease of toxin-antitoxin system